MNALAPRAAYKVDTSRGGNNGEVSFQWMSRPHDERYLSLERDVQR